MIIIPARLDSTRFPNKVLCDIGGIPMVVRTAKIAREIDDVVVATDSHTVEQLCKRFGIEAIITDKNHTSGTDRVAEAARIIQLDAKDVVINLQADEPFIEGEVIEALWKLMNTKNPFMGSCAKEVNNMQHAQDPNLVKVVLNARGNAIYFSRALIPYTKEIREDYSGIYLGHLGIYGFSNKSLQEFCTLPKSTLEVLEGLEQLRAIYHNKEIAIVKVSSQSFGIDTPKDLEAACELFLTPKKNENP